LSSADHIQWVCWILFFSSSSSSSQMVKHNNIIPNQHFRKDWQRYVKTWFDQPSRKESRRSVRISRAKLLAPRPLNLLRPIVHSPTIKYNMKVRAGRGFTLDELRAAKINKKAALGLGIAVDHRRKNRSEESFTVNVNRLKFYQSKLVVFPRNPTSKRIKKGDSSKEELAQSTQITSRETLPILRPTHKEKARKITSQEREERVRTTLRKALTDQKRAGAREKRAKDKADEAAGKKKTAAAAGGGGGEEGGEE